MMRQTANHRKPPQFRAAVASRHSHTTFWADPEDEGAENYAPLTVLRSVQAVQVIYDGRVGLMRAKDVVRLTVTEHDESPELQKAFAAATEALRDVDSFPPYQLPAVAAKLAIPKGFSVIEEAIAAGFPVPNGIIQTSITAYLLAALQRPNGIRIAVEIVNWASERPELVAQIPPLLADLPKEVRQSFVSKAARFLARAGSAPEPYLAMFQAAAGLPPAGAAAHGTTPSEFQPYGDLSLSLAAFHPSPVFRGDILHCRALLVGSGQGKGCAAVARVLEDLRVDAETSDAGSLKVGGGKNVMQRRRRDSDVGALPGRANRKDLVFVPSTEENIRMLCRALRSTVPLLIEGDTGTGKTVSVTAAAERMEFEVIRFNLSSGTTVQDLVGRLQITDDRLELSLQPFTRAFSEGLLLVLDECNLAQEEVLATLETALDTGLLVIPDPSNPARSTREVRRHPGFRLIITQNPCTGLFSGKRHRLSAAFLSRFHPLTLKGLTRDELVVVAAEKLCGVMGGPPEAWTPLATTVADVHVGVQDYVQRNKDKRGVETSLTVFSCRDLINSVKLLTHSAKAARRGGGGGGGGGGGAGVGSAAAEVQECQKRAAATAWCVYGARFLGKEARKDVWGVIRTALERQEGAPPCPDDPLEAVQLCFGRKAADSAEKRKAWPSVAWCADDDNVAAPRNPLVVTERVRDTWDLLDFVMPLGRPVLLVGKCGSGSSHAALGYAAVRTGRHYLCHVTSETLVGGLIGQNVPCFDGKEVTRWVDGPVTEAMVEGRWLILDDLPSASATVLERLNSVLEEDPELYVAERGAGLEKRINVKKKFRVLATADYSQLASLSPAFANRFTVIVMNRMDASERQDEMAAFCRAMLFAGPDATFSRRSPQMRTCGNKAANTAQGYAEALGTCELVGSHDWEVVLDGDATGAVVGIALDPSSSDPDAPASHVWGYASDGRVLRPKAATAAPPAKKKVTPEPPPPRKRSSSPAPPQAAAAAAAAAAPYAAGDVLRVSVRLGDKEEHVSLYKNGAKQWTATLSAEERSSAASLRPFVALEAKGAVATMRHEVPEPEAAEVNDAAAMCADSLSRGTYGLYSVVRAITCARKLAGDARVELSHFRRALLLTEVGGNMTQGGGGGASRRGSRAGSVATSDLGASVKGKGKPSLIAAAMAAMVGATKAPGLANVAHRVSWCLHAGIPVLIADDYCWGVRDELFKGSESVVATTQSTVSEWLGVVLPMCTKDGVRISRVPGPLLRALEGGKNLVVEGISALSAAVQSQLSPLLDTGVLSRPGEGTPLRCRSGFSMAGFCRARDVELLVPKFASKFVVVYLPKPKADDYAGLMQTPDGRVAAACAEMTRDEELPMNVRRFRRVEKRLAALAACAGSDAGVPLTWALCYASTLLPACRTEEDRSVKAELLGEKLVEYGLLQDDAEAARFQELLRQPAALQAGKKKGTVRYEGWGLACELPGDLSRHRLSGTRVRNVVEAVVTIAFATASAETLVLAGPTSCKTLAARMFFALSGQGLEVMHMTCATDTSGLLGSIYPYSLVEYKEMIKREEEVLAGRKGGKGEGFAGWSRMLKDSKEAEAKLAEGTTVFAFKDGPLTEAAKRGVGMVMKAANLPDAQLYTTLGELFHDHRLPLSVATPTGCTIPLKERVPLILTVTCPMAYSLTYVLEDLAVVRCPEYTEEQVHAILAETITPPEGDAKQDEESLLLARTITMVLEGHTMKTWLRIAEFTCRYSTIAGATKPVALVLGAHLLMHLAIDSEDLSVAGWDAPQIQAALGAVPRHGHVDGSKTLQDFVQVEGTTVKLVNQDGEVLGVARSMQSAERLKERVAASPMVPIPAMLKNLSSIFAASSLRMPLLLEGAPGIGKSFLVESAANLLGATFVRVQFSAGTTVSHLFGAPMPTIEDGKRVFKRCDGILGGTLKEATKEKESWVLLDELNLAPPEVQQALSPMLDDATTELSVSGSSERYSMQHVRVFAAVNPAAIGGGRSHLPPSVKDLFTVIQLQELTCSEAVLVARSKFRAQLDIENEELLEGMLGQLSTLHQDVSTDIAQGRLGQEREGSVSIVNLRTLEKVVLLLAARVGKHTKPALKLGTTSAADVTRVKAFFLQVLDVIYKWMFASPADRARINGYLAGVARKLCTFPEQRPRIEAMGHGDEVAFGQVVLLRGAHASGTPPLPPSDALRNKLAALACASGSSLGVLIEGATGSGKTALVGELARICGQRLRVIPVTPNTEISELLGMWVPWKGLGSDSFDLHAALGHEAARLAAQYVSQTAAQTAATAATGGEKKGEAATETQGKRKKKKKEEEDEEDGADKEEDRSPDAVRDRLYEHLNLLSGVSGLTPERLAESTRRVCAALVGTQYEKKAGRLQQLYEKVGAMSFHFAESQLMHAMHDGEWVLLDNIDWAPPAAVERLNSLLEADATFKLVERGDDEDTFRKGKGIHDNFRMFFTSNPLRKHASKLSSAFLNRVVRLVLKPFGVVCERPLKTVPSQLWRHDDTALPNTIFFTIHPDCRDVRFWQYVCTQFHRRAMERDPSVSIRTLRHCLQNWRADIATYASTHTELFLLCGNLLRTYAQVSPKEASAFMGDLRDVLTEAEVLMLRVRKPTRPRKDKDRDDEDVSRRKSEAFSDGASDYDEEELADDQTQPPDAASPDAPESASEAGGSDGDADSEGDAAEAPEVPPEKLIPEAVLRMQDTCLQNLKSASMAEKVDEDTFLSCDREALVDLATELCQMWREKSHGILEELLDNLVSAPDVQTTHCLYGICTAMRQEFGGKYQGMTNVHLLCMKLYTMEGPDIDRLLGFEEVPVWKVGKGFEAEQELWREYVRTYKGKRNGNIYTVINTNLRQALKGKEEERMQARLRLKKWIKFVGLLMTMCDKLTDITVYRALNGLPPEVVSSISGLKPGDCVGWPAASSTSKRKYDSFLGDKPEQACRFTVRGVCRGLELEHVSQYTEEEEILLPPFTLLKVEETVEGKHGLEVLTSVQSVVCFDDPHLLLDVRRFIADAKDAFYRLRFKITNRPDAVVSLSPLQTASAVADLPDSLVSALAQRRQAPRPDGADVAATAESLSEDVHSSERRVVASFAESELGCERFRAAAQRNGGSAALAAAEEKLAFLCGGSGAGQGSTEGAAADGVQSLLPCNTFTRFEAAASGVELYIPGLIKAITTNFTYNKVFASKTAGGARSYACVIALDGACLLSRMDGVPRDCLELLVALRQGLAASEIDPCVLLYYGSRAYCVHASGDWVPADSLSLAAHLHAAAQQPQEEGSASLGDPLRLASAVARDMRGKKKQVFVLTDSEVPFQNQDVGEALRDAEEHGVDVLGLGIGSSVHLSLPRAISVPSPGMLGRALARFLHGPYGPPEQAKQGKQAVEEKEVFWGRHHSSIEIDGFQAAAVGMPRTKANVLSCEAVPEGEEREWALFFDVKTPHEACVGVGCSMVSQQQDLLDPRATASEAAQVVAVPSGAAGVSVAVRRVEGEGGGGMRVVVTLEKKREELYNEPLQIGELPQLLVGFVGPGSVSVVKREGKDKDKDKEKEKEGADEAAPDAEEAEGDTQVGDGTAQAWTFESPPPMGVSMASGALKYHGPPVDAGARVPLASGFLEAGYHLLPIAVLDPNLKSAGDSWTVGVRGQGSMGSRSAGTGIAVWIPSEEEGPGAVSATASLCALRPSTDDPSTHPLSVPVRHTGGGRTDLRLFLELPQFDGCKLPKHPEALKDIFECKEPVPLLFGHAESRAHFPPHVVRNTRSWVLAHPVSTTFQVLSEVGLQCDFGFGSDGELASGEDLGVQGSVESLLIEIVKGSGGCSMTFTFDTGKNVVKRQVSPKGDTIRLTLKWTELAGRKTTLRPGPPPGTSTGPKKPTSNPWFKCAGPIEVVNARSITTSKTKYAAAIRGPITSGYHEWDVILSGAKGCMNGATVGVATERIGLETTLYRKSTTWLVSNHGKMSHGVTAYDCKNFNGLEHTISVIVDMDNRSVRFAIDGQGVSQELRIENTVSAVHPLIGLYRKGTKAEYVPKIGGPDGDQAGLDDDDFKDVDAAKDGGTDWWTTGSTLNGLAFVESVDGTFVYRGHEKRWQVATGPLLDTSERVVWQVTVSPPASASPSLNGVAVGVVSEDHKDTFDESQRLEPMFDLSTAWLYTNQGTLSHKQSYVQNDQYFGDAGPAVIKLSMRGGVLKFSLENSDGKMIEQLHKFKLPSGIKVRPVLSCYQDGTMFAVKPGIRGKAPLEEKPP